MCISVTNTPANKAEMQANNVEKKKKRWKRVEGAETVVPEAIFWWLYFRVEGKSRGEFVVLEKQWNLMNFGKIRELVVENRQIIYSSSFKYNFDFHKTIPNMNHKLLHLCPPSNNSNDETITSSIFSLSRNTKRVSFYDTIINFSTYIVSNWII